MHLMKACAGGWRLRESHGICGFPQ